MLMSNIRQLRFTLNLDKREDKELYDILKKQKNMSLYFRNAINYYHDSKGITKSDLARMEERIINEIKNVSDTKI